MTVEKTKHVVQGSYPDLALHTIGWKAFQDLCAQICEEEFKVPVEIYREANDGGQDAVLLIPSELKGAAAVGTVQCKHTSKMNAALKLSDITPELAKVKNLVEQGQASSYIFITNMSVDATVAVDIRSKLMELGVRKPQIFGQQKLVQIIRSSSRLRALIPQVYGLGDLSIIIDERAIEQTKLLLANWLPKLKAYVSTEAHNSAVHALEKHGAVILLGNASTGKSTIGAILSTIAAEDPNHTVLKLTSPREFDEHWNSHDRRRFFWIDDAFGSNTTRADYVNDWSSLFSKVQTAISLRNRFLFTSRLHIYLSAKKQLGQRNLPMFIDESAVVNVGKLKPEEKSQILYNHINYGDQEPSWRREVKPHLEAVAAVEEFLPGIAERLGKKAFTKSVNANEYSLTKFMAEPREHLMETINALDNSMRAALVLVYVHRSNLIVESCSSSAVDAVEKATGISFADMCERLPEMDGSFLKVNFEGIRKTWSFEHPTISDALTAILGEQPHMMEALLRGAGIDTILENFQCEGLRPIPDAAMVPASLNDVLKDRLIITPDEYARNWALFSFLANRVSDEMFSHVVSSDPYILERTAWRATRASNDPKIRTCARALRLGLLSDEIRLETATHLENTALSEFELSFCEDEEIVAMIPPRRLLALGTKLRRFLENEGEKFVEGVSEGADLDEDADSHFEHIKDGLRILEDVAEIDAETDETHRKVYRAIEIETEILNERQAEIRAEEDEQEVNWTFASSSERPSPPTAQSSDSNQSVRSIFEDIDR